MHLSDRPTIEVEVWIEAPPDEVWQLVTDLDSMGEWSPEYQGGQWLDGAPGPDVGARFEGRNQIGDREWTTVSTVTDSKPGEVFAWLVGDPANPGARWRFKLIPVGEGTRLLQQAEMGPGPSGLARAIARHPDREEELIVRRLDTHRNNMTLTLERLKAAAERRDR